MSRLVIVRHGNTFDKGDTLMRVGGRTDLPLSESGRLQAEALGRHFSGRCFDTVLSSPLRRQTETANAILERLGGLELQTEPRLTEVDYGPDEGQPEADVVARLGEGALRLWDEARIVPDGWHVDEAGLSALWAELLQRARREDLLVVTSNGTARYVFDHVQRGEAPLKLATGAFGEIDASGDEPRLVCWNVRPA